MDFLANDILNRTLSNEEKELIYSYVGGKPVDIVYVIEKLKIKELNEILEFILKNEIQKLKYLLEDIKEESEGLYDNVINVLKLFKNSYEIEDMAIPKKIREFLVGRNILFLNPTNGIIKPQSFLVWNAIKKLFGD